MPKIAIIGSGITGCTIARVLAEKGCVVKIYEEREHIGGNCFDKKEYGSYTHSYGPHLFHTNSGAVVKFLENHTDFKPYYHKVLAYIDGQLVPLPYSLKSLELTHPEYIAKRVGQKLYSEYGYGNSVSIQKMLDNADIDIKNLAVYIYEKVFAGYSTKQWGIKDPLELDKSVLNRVPVKISKNTDYFEDKYQYLPSQGYETMIKSIVNHNNIDVRVKKKARIAINGEELCTVNGKKYDHVFYSGLIDELFNFKYGELPYRSLHFDKTIHEKSKHKGKAMTINFPSHDKITRISDFSFLSDVYNNTYSEKGIAFTELPGQYSKMSEEFNIPYYPIFTKKNKDMYERYAAEAEKIKCLTMCGRLGLYKYLDMDDSVLIALRQASDFITREEIK